MTHPADILLPLALAGAAVGLVLGAWQLATGTESRDRRRLARRLEQGGQYAQSAAGTIEEQIRLLREQQADPLAEMLGRWRVFADLNRALRQAFPDLTLRKFLLLAGGSAVGTAMVVFTLRGSFTVAGIAGLMGAYVPFVVVAQYRMRRQRLMIDQLPDALDFLGRSLRAGHSLPIGLQLLGQELPQPLAGEFARCHDEVSLGTSPDLALKSMVARIDSTDFAFFVTAVLVQRQTGGDLARVLDNITEMLRQRIRLEQHVKARTAEGRFTGYILAGFPLVMFVLLFLLNPSYPAPLLETFVGNALLATAVVLSGLGLLVIRKIVDVKI